VPPADLILAGGRVVLPGSDHPVAADLALAEGRIAAILAPGAAVPAREIVAIPGLVVLPGVVDAHLHLGHGADISRPRTPEDAAQETLAAAAGGVSCFIPYLLSTEPYEQVLPEVIRVTEAGARIDFSYHPIISTEAQLAGISDYAQAFGTPSFKIFLNNRGGEGKRLGLPDIDDGFLFRLLEAAAAAGGMVCPHPEAIEIAFVLRDRVRRADPDGTGGLSAWNATRPPFVEAEAIRRAGYLARVTGCPIYFVHTSSAEALAAAEAERAAGRRVFIETCPHYLTHDVGSDVGTRGKINPPLREQRDREALWRALLEGRIDTVGSDHVHRGLSAKDGGIWGASPGCPGLETLLPVLLSEGHAKRGMSLGAIARVSAENPARIMGLGDAKGRIAPGMEADLAIVDPAARWRMERAGVRSSAGWSLYEGWEFTGRVVHTLVRGRFVWRDGEEAPDTIGTGRFRRRRLPDG
jgi:dihydropyrimidinase/allantoinase